MPLTQEQMDKLWQAVADSAGNLQIDALRQDVAECKHTLQVLTERFDVVVKALA